MTSLSTPNKKRTPTTRYANVPGRKNSAQPERSAPQELLGKFRELVHWGKTNDVFLDAVDDFKDGYYYRIANKAKTNLTFQIIRPPNSESDSKLGEESTSTQSLILKGKPDPDSIKIFSGEILKAIGKVTILREMTDGNLSFQPLGIEVAKDYRITNRTARRIGIENYEKKWGELVIPPFGTRSVNSDLLCYYQFLEWQRQDLIRVELEEKASKGSGSWTAIWDWIKLLPGLLLVLLVGFGIPLWVVYHFGEGNRLIHSFLTGAMFNSQQETLGGLGRLFQAGFICEASILPALFYYLFGRQQVEKLRQKFFHDVLILDPHIYTLSEAESKYDTLLSSAYGLSSSNSPFTILLLMFSTAILAAGWTLTIVPYGDLLQNANSVIDYFSVNSSALTLGFLGAYFFSLNMIFRRYVRADLTPKTYAYITVRMLITFVLIWAIGALPEFSSNFMKGGFLPLAFIIGIFPENGFRVIRDAARKFLKDKDAGDEKYPLTDLEGLNQYDQARLLEEGIENVENLAHHNLVELLAFTRIPTSRLVDMFDQAILYLHLGLFDELGNQSIEESNKLTSKAKSGPGGELLKYLKSIGIRTATDLIRLIESLEDSNDSILSETKFSQAKTIRITFSDDEWLSYILNWRKESSREAVIQSSFVNNPYRFYETESPEAKKTNGKVKVKKHKEPKNITDFKRQKQDEISRLPTPQLIPTAKQGETPVL